MLDTIATPGRTIDLCKWLVGVVLCATFISLAGAVAGATTTGLKAIRRAVYREGIYDRRSGIQNVDCAAGSEMALQQQ